VSDATEQNGVVTNTGQTAIRDIIADNNPNIPTEYGLGSSQNIPTESDTSLNSQIRDTKLNRTQLQNFDTVTEFSNAVDIPSDSPVTIVENTQRPGIGAVTVDPVTYVTEAENATTIGQTSTIDKLSLSGLDGNTQGRGVILDFASQAVIFDFTVNQDIAIDNLFAGVLFEVDNFTGQFDFFFDNNQILSRSFNNETQENVNTSSASVNGQILQKGTEHSLDIVLDSINGGTLIIDALYAFDDRAEFDITRPNSGKTTDTPPGSFDGETYIEPELFPANASVSLPEFSTRRELTELEVFQTWNDTNTNASVTLNLGTESNTVDNPTRNAQSNIRETISVSPSNAARSGNIDFNLSRDNDAGDDTFPKFGDERQEVSFHILNGNPSAVNRSDIGEATTRTIFRSGTLTGNTLRESGQKAGADLLTHSIFADIDPEDDNIIPSEQLRFIPE
jgi:hypothetical protein